MTTASGACHCVALGGRGKGYLSYSHDNREMLKVAAVVQGVLADAVAGSERLVFIAAVSQVILWTCKPSETGRDLADKANCRDP